MLPHLTGHAHVIIGYVVYYAIRCPGTLHSSGHYIILYVLQCTVCYYGCSVYYCTTPYLTMLHADGVLHVTSDGYYYSIPY